MLRDLGSRNGCRVGGKRLTRDVPAALEPGHVAEIGRVLVVVRRGASLEEAASAATGAVRARAVAPPRGDHDVVIGGAVARMLDLVERVAQASLSVLLFGETGVGKDVFAELLHRMSPRRARPFARIHCAAISESLFESELFGHEQGAFTGASKARVGLLESADGGTVFLDEIGELPPATQVKLLRVLEDRRVTRVGSVRAQQIDVRFVAATNRDLEDAVRRGDFRRDLYHRLDGISLTIPPLRERTDELEPLARRFFERVTSGRTLVLTDAARKALFAHPFEGNVRELRNVIERAALLSGAGTVDVAHLQLAPSLPSASVAVPAHLTPAEQAEARAILAALARCGGSQTDAAKVLGISRRTLLNRLDAYGLPRPRK
jgi:transcriptional regulator with PAS, ATPase and Fis domain